MDPMEAFDFHLPHEQIALNPASPRESAKLLHVLSSKNETDPPNLHLVGDLPKLLKAGDLLVFNDTKVIPAKIQAWRTRNDTTAHIELTLDRPLPNGAWRALVRNAKRLKKSDELHFFSSLSLDRNHSPLPKADLDFVTAEILTIEHGVAEIKFSVTGEAFHDFLERVGKLALPPYIERPDGPTQEDEKNYQTVFAKNEGAVAAPTASLHFTENLLDSLKQAKIDWTFVTLHVGAGTFLPVHGSPENHVMHPEWGKISEATAKKINQARENGSRIIPVGTTSLRLLESAVNTQREIEPWIGETAIFLRPGYEFRAADALLTNFHLPRSTLFMLVCAFAGTTKMQNAYQHAIKNNLRFYSYGDLCLLEKKLDHL
ncbi:tRNA preQ1(34) S-adenosylmethionine ribosyltransferase-isomerase QueA [Acetobacteraceae bacterium]|nr:tRNA preQ1(34) S-adenosylmethionine ribosyltransferase-isomerase QueA [Acetobacteraceae bacterium]